MALRDPEEIEHNGRKVSDILTDDTPYLYKANLYGANLSEADLSGADLYGANLSEADLSGADLSEANLLGANMYRADLSEADLSEADLKRVNLKRANLRETKIDEEYIKRQQICPQQGSFIAYKAADNHILKIEIPEDAERLTSLTSRKCRASKVEVLEVLDSDGNSCEDTVASGWKWSDFKYEEGETAYPDEYDDDWKVECSHGIHFFVTKREALDWDDIAKL